MEFTDVKMYLDALGRDTSLAAVPIQMAADALGLSHAAISGQLRKGTLEGIKIRRTRLVRAHAVSRRLSAYEADVRTVTSYLERIARTGATTTYTPVMGEIDRRSTVPNDRSYIGRVLGDISRRSHEKGFLLSALVFNSARRRPSGSFYGLADEIDREAYRVCETDAEYLQLQLDKIFAKYRA